jgi:hypothetical protein
LAYRPGIDHQIIISIWQAGLLGDEMFPVLETLCECIHPKPKLSCAEEMSEAGNYTVFQNYQAGVMLTSNTTTYLDCYNQCISLNGEPFQACMAAI